MGRSERAVPEPEPDGLIRSIAGHRHGVVRRAWLLGDGVPRHAIDNRVRNGRLVQLHPGVYRAGYAPMPLEAEMAAVAACGDRSFLSHDSAAALADLRADRRPATVEVSVEGYRRIRRPGIRVHRVARLGPDEVTELHRIPATTPARTILDLAARLGPHELERIVATAERMGLAGPEDVGRLVDRYPTRSGTKLLRQVLALDGGPALTRSPPEALLLDLLRAAQLRPEMNRRVHGYEVDCLFRTEKLIIEVDGLTFHSSPRMVQRDRTRDRKLRAAGFEVFRYTVKDLTGEPEVVLKEIIRALTLRGG